MKKQTAGHDLLGDLAPQFAQLNDDVLFGQVWSRESQLSPRDRSLATISALVSAGNTEQLSAHIRLGLAHGLTKEEIVETLTHLAFYCGWPKAWSSLLIAQAIFEDKVNQSGEHY